MKGKHEEKKNGSKPDVDAILLATVILELIKTVIELIRVLTD